MFVAKECHAKLGPSLAVVGILLVVWVLLTTKAGDF